ncbi:cytochrome P450 [Mycena belliarum]|uniref:Cytochrome P450 n=1 Tax=Mycena belliarum TaxID=1033014 RepID=A0AAD6UC30_9AGAR|nr:cytochrome P450 [Mycena belliae]
MSALILLAALTCHLFFKRYEPTNIPLLVGLLLLPPLLLTFLTHDGSLGVSTLKSLLHSYTLYFSALGLSILAYRASPLHPLYAYPGPVPCRLSKFYLAYVSSRGKMHLYVQRLHDAYGPVVRIGPNELSISDVSLLPNILGANGMPKGPLWDGRRISGQKGPAARAAARGNLINSRDLTLHAAARKAWTRAFSPAAIRGYEPILIRRVAQLAEALAGKGEGGVVDLSRWLSFFAFDFMGDLAFGGGFELMRDGDSEGLWHIMERGLYLPALTQHVPWSTDLLPYLPRVGQEMRALGKFAFEQARRRLDAGSLQNDLFYHLMDESLRADAAPYPFPLVVSNAVLAIIAGSDTSATVLTNTFFLLLAHPGSYRRLQAELDGAFPVGGKEPTDAAVLAGLPYLNAVIKESLRMLPPVATSLQRAPTVGSGPKVLGDRFVIPEGTAVVVPPYTLHHDPRYFSPSPEQYMPERWLAHDDRDPDSAKKFINNEDAFIPFSMGPANCVGRSLAMLEMRMVVAFVMQGYEMRFADGYDEGRWEAELKDYFVMQKGSLPVVLTRRSCK